MSEKNLKSLRFHGLDDIYKIPSTAEDVGAATLEEVSSAKTSAVNESKTYTDAAVQKARPRNLLDNSDFRNPINQRGQTSYTEQGYTIDRWKTIGALSVTIGSDGITLANTGTNTLRFEQTIPAELISSGMRYTVAITTENGRFCGSCELSTDAQSVISAEDFYCQIQISSGNAVIQIRQRAGYTTKYKNIALYESEYTLETIPEYQPKGYAVELAECQRYFYRIRANWKWIASGICTSATAAMIPMKLPRGMRVNPTVTIPDASKIKIRCGSVGSQVPTAIAWNFANDIFDIIQMESTVSGASSGAVAVLYFDNGGIIEFSADL